jgi:tRNA pseudouridine55 synthase
VSAIKVDGVASHERARRGEAIELPPREVTLRSAIVSEVTGETARVSLESSKGFYVRSFARDLAARLGTVAHLTSLRRTRSGAFSLVDSVDGERLRAARDDHDARDAVRERLLPLRALEGRMPSVRVSLAQSLFLLQGRAIEAPEGCPEGVVLVFAEREDVGLPPQPLGLAERSESKLSPRRNFAPAALSSEWQPWLDGARSP